MVRQKTRTSSNQLYVGSAGQLRRLGVDYVDIFYSHRPDPDTPLEETMGALATAVQQGKALHIGLSNYGAQRTREAAKLLHGLGVPPLNHQPSYSILDRWVERDGLLEATAEAGMGCIAFVPLAQGLLTGRYLDGIPEGSRATQGKSLNPASLTPAMRECLAGLRRIAAARGQSLAQLALAWVLRDERVTSALIGASRPEQLAENVAALDAGPLTEEELAAIDACVRPLTGQD